MRIRTDTKGRDETLRRLMQATGENTKTKALFTAARHYLTDKKQKEQVIDDLARSRIQVQDPFRREEEISIVEALSTSELPLEAEITTRVGHESE